MFGVRFKKKILYNIVKYSIFIKKTVNACTNLRCGPYGIIKFFSIRFNDSAPQKTNVDVKRKKKDIVL